MLPSSRGSLLQAAIAMGIGLGSLAAGYLSGGKIEYGLIPLGATGITVFGFLLALHGLSFSTVLIFLAVLGFFGGFFIVPISALLQHRPEEQHRGGVLASRQSFVLCWDFGRFGCLLRLQTFSASRPSGNFPLGIDWDGGGAGLLALAPAGFTAPVAAVDRRAHAVPDAPEGPGDHSRARGRFADAEPRVVGRRGLLVIATDRPIRFLMFKDAYDHPLIKPFAKILKIIPIEPDQGPHGMIYSLSEASEALRNGEVVCIFQEGEITRAGQMLPFRRGFKRIIKGIDVPIIPVNIDGIWGSIFSFSEGHFLWKWPPSIPWPVRIAFGEPLPSTATATEVQQAVLELRVQHR